MRVRGICSQRSPTSSFDGAIDPWYASGDLLALHYDAAVITTVFGLTSHIKPVHRAAAARALGKDINKT
jgi:hypothetical protein